MKTSLFVIHYPTFGGPHNQAVRLDSALEAKGWRTIVALPEEEGNAEQRLLEAGVKVVKLPLHRIRAKLNPILHIRFIAGFFSGIRALRRVIREEQIDLVIVGGLVNPHSAIAARLEGVPVVWQLLDTRAPGLLVRLFMPLVLWLSDSVMTTGHAVAAAHPGTERLGNRLVSFFPPVDVDQFRMLPERRAAARRELGIDPEVTVVGNVSNVNPQKGQITFVEAAATVRRGHRDVVFVILGATYPQHADYLSEIRRSAQTAGLVEGRDLIIHDPGGEVDLYASALDIFWLTSEPRSEGIPTVVEEALSLGLPVVATDVGSVKEAVFDGVNGFVVPAREPGAIAQATDRLIDDGAFRRELSGRAREDAVERFAVERCTETHLKAFRLAEYHAAGRKVRH